MKCIDAIEGTVKQIVEGLHRTAVETGMDDTGYVLNVRAVIEATDAFLRQNQEILETPSTLKMFLYNHAKRLWLASRQQASDPSVPDSGSVMSEEEIEYAEYCYDYVYHHGSYPQ